MEISFARSRKGVASASSGRRWIALLTSLTLCLSCRFAYAEALATLSPPVTRDLVFSDAFDLPALAEAGVWRE